jgi:hypothetical protein
MRKTALILPSFGVGGMECQAVEMVNRVGEEFRFHIVSMTSKLSCKERIHVGNSSEQNLMTCTFTYAAFALSSPFMEALLKYSNNLFPFKLRVSAATAFFQFRTSMSRLDSFVFMRQRPPRVK